MSQDVLNLLFGAQLPQHAATLKAVGYIRKPISFKTLLGLAQQHCPPEAV